MARRSAALRPYAHSTPQIVPLGDGVFEVDAACPLDVVAETVHLELHETDAQTVGGLVLSFSASWRAWATPWPSATTAWWLHELIPREYA